MNQAPISSKPRGSLNMLKWLWIVLIIVVIIAGGFFGWFYLMGPEKIASRQLLTKPTAGKLIPILVSDINLNIPNIAQLMMAGTP